ncbi:unnamed protein product [Sphacelaria rigidula]
MTICERIESTIRKEMTIRKRLLCFAGTLVRQDETRLPKRIMFGWLAGKGSRRLAAAPNTGGTTSRGNLRALWALPCKGSRRK